MVVSRRDERATISILQSTKDTLDSIKHRGQTYDGVIQELIEAWKKEQEVEETGQRLQPDAGRSR